MNKDIERAFARLTLSSEFHRIDSKKTTSNSRGMNKEDEPWSISLKLRCPQYYHEGSPIHAVRRVKQLIAEHKREIATKTAKGDISTTDDDSVTVVGRKMKRSRSKSRVDMCALSPSTCIKKLRFTDNQDSEEKTVANITHFPRMNSSGGGDDNSEHRHTNMTNYSAQM